MMVASEHRFRGIIKVDAKVIWVLFKSWITHVFGLVEYDCNVSLVEKRDKNLKFSDIKIII